MEQRVLSLFSGIGAFEKALQRAKIEWMLINYCEWDKYAAKSYSLIHKEYESKNLGDITKVDWKRIKNIDLLTYGFPCQDVSVAGLQKGLEHEGSKTRSGLVFDALEGIRTIRPRICIAENVKGLLSKKFDGFYNMILNELEMLGYNNYVKVLNAKDYGVPQNRERVFIVSIRKDVDNRRFEFQKPMELVKKLKDVLEDEVDEKYYISQDKVDKLLYQLGEGKKYHSQDVSYAIDSNYYKGPSQSDLVNGKRQTVLIREATKKGYAVAHEGDSINIQYPGSETRRGRVGHQVAQTLETSVNQEVLKIMQIGNCMETGTRKNPNQGRVYDAEGLSPTLSKMDGGGRQPHILEGERYYRIRKLTPKECLVGLMDFDDKDYQILKDNGISNSQIYNMSGNSIVVAVAQSIIQSLKDAGLI